MIPSRPNWDATIPPWSPRVGLPLAWSASTVWVEPSVKKPLLENTRTSGFAWRADTLKVKADAREARKAAKKLGAATAATALTLAEPQMHLLRRCHQHHQHRHQPHCLRHPSPLNLPQKIK
jgi:hypothetical protein